MSMSVEYMIRSFPCDDPFILIDVVLDEKVVLNNPHSYRRAGEV